MDKTQAPAVGAEEVPEGLDLAAFAAGASGGSRSSSGPIPGVVDAISGYEGGSVDQSDL